MNGPALILQEILVDVEKDEMETIWIYKITRTHKYYIISAAVCLGLLIAVLFYGWQATGANADSAVKLVIFAFSTQEQVLNQGILPAFEKAWETETGQELEVEAVFGSSGSLAGQIDLGAPADVALFSNVRNVKWLKIGRMVRTKTEPVIYGYSPMVIVTRPGNLYHIADFADLTQPGIRLVHADPRTSGAGEWSLLAEYGCAMLETQDADLAREQLLAVWDNVSLLGESARVILSLFEVGAGDALITYEQDAQLAEARGVPLEIVVPNCTIITEYAAVIVDANVKSREMPVVTAFMDYLISKEGQQIFEEYNLRPIQNGQKKFPPISQPFKVEDLGGWTQAYTQLVEKLWKREIETRHDLELNISLVDIRE